MATAKKNAIKVKKRQKRVVVGRVDKQPIPGIPGNVRRAWFETVSQGETYIEKIKKIDPEGVERGEYYIDAQEPSKKRSAKR